MITGMSCGALSYNAKVALAQGARARRHLDDHRRRRHAAGRARALARAHLRGAARAATASTSTTCAPADAIELTIGQGAKPGTGGLLLGSKVSAEIARPRDLPPGVDQRSPARHPDFLGPDDMIIKIEELREATDWQVPIFVKMGATRVFDDVKLAAKAGADVVVVDGMEGGTARLARPPPGAHRHPDAGRRRARRARRSRTWACTARCSSSSPAASGSGVDVAKALALGADAVYIGTAALIALNCNKPLYVEDYDALGTEPVRLPPLPHRAAARSASRRRTPS